MIKEPRTRSHKTWVLAMTFPLQPCVPGQPPIISRQVPIMRGSWQEILLGLLQVKKTPVVLRHSSPSLLWPQVQSWQVFVSSVPSPIHASQKAYLSCHFESMQGQRDIWLTCQITAETFPSPTPDSSFYSLVSFFFSPTDCINQHTYLDPGSSITLFSRGAHCELPDQEEHKHQII